MRPACATLALVGLTACGNSLPVIPPTATGAPAVRLGESPYSILLPAAFEVSEARGKEGQLGYFVGARGDDPDSISGFIEIRRGHPIGGDLLYSGGTAFARSTLAGADVTWATMTAPNGFLLAYAEGPGEIRAHVGARTRSGINQMIAILATMEERPDAIPMPIAEAPPPRAPPPTPPPPSPPPAAPAPPTRPQAVAAADDAGHLVVEAQGAADLSRWGSALRLCEKALVIEESPEAVEICALAACNLRSESKLTRFLPRIRSEAAIRRVRKACRENGVRLKP